MKAISLVVLLLLTGCGAGASSVLCTRVVDGDTIKVRFGGEIESVRLLGIDAPEGAVTPATLRMRELVEGRPVRLVWQSGKPARDMFGRLLAYVEIDGQDVGETLLREGVVETYERFPHPRMERYRL